MFQYKTLRDVDVKDKIVLVRTDYNVPLETDPETGQPYITSDLRIRASLPTLEYLLKHKAAKIILISHLGRPAGKKAPLLSLVPVAERLAELLPGVSVNFVDEASGPEVEMAVDELAEGGILLLENLRFSAEEEANSESYAREIVDSTHAELFVQDGFAVVHRAHASTAAIPQLIPAVAGLLLEQEIKALEQVIEQPERPFIVIVGGAKVSDKQPLIEKFLPLADRLLVGGKIAADGYISPDPKVYVAEDFDENSSGEKLDIGPLATAEFVRALQDAKTVLWSGCLGKTEDPTYATASTIVAKTIGENPNLTSVICGGDTAGFVENLCMTNPELHFTLISTGGSAALALLTGEPLPGVDALESA